LQNFLFLTTSNLTTNPRLLKEVKLVSSSGNKATVLLFHLQNWSLHFEDELSSTYANIKIITLHCGREKYFDWIIASFLQFILGLLPYRKLNSKLLAYSFSKQSYILVQALKLVSEQFDWVIAHNPGAFYPAYLYSIENRTKLGIDIEDYHPGENNPSFTSEFKELLLFRTINSAKYISCASPLYFPYIERITQKRIPLVEILNSFDFSEFNYNYRPVNDIIKIVWFSQNIDKNRGLEFVISNLKRYVGKIELHLIGNLNKEFFEKYIKNNEFIVIHKPLLQIDLHSILSEFDIGLASDIPIDLNRDLAISNKIISYVQSGLFLLATKTNGHNYFFNTFKLAGAQYDLSSNSFDLTMNSIFENIHSIRDKRQERISAALKYQWSILSKSLLKVWGN
jgi:hypothetical protein